MNTFATDHESAHTPRCDEKTEPPRRMKSAELLGAARELIIEHGGGEYRLRLTSNGKLILTK